MAGGVRCFFLVAACGQPLRLPAELAWQEAEACGVSDAERTACAAIEGAKLGRPIAVCGGKEPPPPTPVEVRRGEAAYRSGELRCVCVTPAMWDACLKNP